MDYSTSELCISRCKKALNINKYNHLAWKLLSEVYSKNKDYLNSTDATLRYIIFN